MDGVGALVWLVAGLILAGAEVLTGDFFLLMIAGGALATAGFSALSEFPVWVDAIVFAVASIALLLGVRPALKRKLLSGHLTPMNMEALTGRQATVLEDVRFEAGQIKLAGEVWTARPLDEAEVYPAGSTVTVMHITGATAVVWKEP